MTEFGNIALIEEREISEGGNVTIKLPGVKSGDMASRSVKPEVGLKLNYYQWFYIKYTLKFVSIYKQLWCLYKYFIIL